MRTELSRVFVSTGCVAKLRTLAIVSGMLVACVPWGVAGSGVPAASRAKAAVVAKAKSGELAASGLAAASEMAPTSGAAPTTLPREGTEPEGVVHVCAAASLRDALVRVAARFQESHPRLQVRLNFGASNQLARQILEGAPADLFFSADERSMDVVEKAGRLVPQTRFDFLTNALVIVVPGRSKLTIGEASDLIGPAVERIAICDDAVPVGHYARSWLLSKGVLPKLEGRIVRPDDARAALAMVGSGGVDAGFVYVTDAKNAKRVKVAFAVPDAETPGIVYPAALLTQGQNPAGAKAFLAFATSSPAVYLFRGDGFGAPGPR